MSSTQKLVLSFVAGAIVGGSLMQFASGRIPNGTALTLIGGASKDVAVTSSGTAASQNTASVVNLEAGGVTAPIGTTVVVADQKPGSTVVLSALTLSNPAWVAVREDNEGEPGRVLGARRFEAGVWSGETVELLRATVPQGFYYAVMFNDDGDHQFDLNKDLPLSDASGKAVMTSFKTQ